MRKIILPVTALVTLALAPACSHAPVSHRAPASFKVSTAMPVENEFGDWARKTVSDSYRNKRTTLSKEIAGLLKSSAPTQRLLADHDMKLEKKDVVAAEKAECQLWETYPATHVAEEKLLALQHAFYGMGDAEAYSWFVSQVWPVKKDSPALAVAKATFVTRMKSYHDRLCSQPATCSIVFPTSHADQPFYPLDQNAFMEFKKKNMTKLAGDESATLPKSVSCPTGADRSTAAVTPATGQEYDWKKFGFTGAGPELNDGEFAITYDDGPHGVYTPQIAQLWVDSGLPLPTFFWLARNFGAKNPNNVELGKQIRDAGFEIGCHSRNHANLDLLSRAVSLEKLGKNNSSTFADELKTPPKDFVAWRLGHLHDELYVATNEIYSQLELDVPGKPLDRLFRLPGGVGVGQPEVGKELALTHARHYHWSIDSLDFQDPNPQSIVDRVEKLMETKKKGIILFHDIHPQSVEATRILLQKWKNDKTIKFVKVPRFKPGYEY